MYDSLSGIKVKYADQTLPYRTYHDKCRQIEPGDVIEHKYLGHALQHQGTASISSTTQKPEHTQPKHD